MTTPPSAVDSLPVAAVERFIAQEERRLHARGRELKTLRDAVDRVAVHHSDEWADDAAAATVVSGAELAGLSRSTALNRTWIAVRTVDEVDQGHGLLADLEPARGPSCDNRTLVPAAVMDSVFALRRLFGPADQGDIPRVLPDVPMSMAVTGSALILPVGEGYRVLRTPALVDLAAVLFDLLWIDGVAIADSHGAAAGDEMVLGLLGRGAKDEAIARYLGLSLRTVRRRIAVMMSRYGARTRFELGARVAERGPLTTGPTRSAVNSRNQIGSAIRKPLA